MGKHDDVPAEIPNDAVWAAQEEVTRHVTLGLHPNVVGLVDVGLFWEPPNRSGCNSRSAHTGLVCDMYEIDVRQFLKKSFFTQGGMRHVLNSVLGLFHLRGCFSRERFKLQQLGPQGLGEFQHHAMTEFQYQIPNSFEVRSSV